MSEGTRKIEIGGGTATLLGALLAFIGVVVTTALSQWGAAKLEDRRAQTEIVLEIMRTSDREETLEKLNILAASGLLDDDDGKLIRAVTEAPEIAFKTQEVNIPIPVQCIDPSDIPAEVEPLEDIPQDARRAVALVAAQALEYKAQNQLFRAMLIACTDSLPSLQEVIEDDTDNGSVD